MLTAAYVIADCGGGVLPWRLGQNLRNAAGDGGQGGQIDRPAHLLRRIPGLYFLRTH